MSKISDVREQAIRSVLSVNSAVHRLTSVSYTHLDVYKRQEHRYLGRTDEPLDEAGVFELENALNNGVYKACLLYTSITGQGEAFRACPGTASG